MYVHTQLLLGGATVIILWKLGVFKISHSNSTGSATTGLITSGGMKLNFFSNGKVLTTGAVTTDVVTTGLLATTGANATAGFF